MANSYILNILNLHLSQYSKLFQYLINFKIYIKDEDYATLILN
jgi:hypothetical protein